MYCKRVIYVNWGNIPHLEFEFGPINLFSGGNGSGKTTAADGIQSLMTAAHENLFTYNPGQDETTQRGRGGKQVRTLASYILGCDDGSYARTRLTDGYVAGVFHPTKGESAEPFTAVMCVRARLDESGSSRQARQEELQFLIIPNQQLSLSDFVRDEKSGKYVVSLTEVAQFLKMKLGKNAIEIYDKKGPYLRRLYGAFKGINGAVSDREAKHAARTFSNFMAYKPVKSISEFVAREILDPKDLSEDIRQVSDLMKTIHSMDEETRYIQVAINNLDEAHSLADQYISHWVSHCVGEYSEITRQLMVKQKVYLQQKTEQRKNLDQITETEHQLAISSGRKEQLHAQLIELEAQRQGIKSLRDKDSLEQDIESIKQQLIAAVSPLLAHNQQLVSNYDAATQLKKHFQSQSIAVDIPAIELRGFRELLNAVVDGKGDTGLDAQQLLTKDWVGIESLEGKLADVNQLELLHSQFYEQLHHLNQLAGTVSLRDQVYTVANNRFEKLQKTKKQIAQKETEVKKLQQHKVNYPAHVVDALVAINQQCPAAKPAVLCDYIEILDPDWQMAIEGYLGGSRFSIIVDMDYEADAIRIVRSMGGRRNSAKIIQGGKAQRDARKSSLSDNSIVEIMEFKHKTVEYYLTASYGSVIRVNDADSLKKTPRGITADGLGSGNYSMFRCDVAESELVFGQAARERALIAKRLELDALVASCHDIEAGYHALSRVHELFDQVKPVSSSQIINGMISNYRKLQTAENQLDSIDLSDFEDIEQQLQDSRAAYSSAENALKTLAETLGGYKSKIDYFDSLITKIDSENELLNEEQEIKVQAVMNAADLYPALQLDQQLSQAEQRAKSAGADFSFTEELLAHRNSMDAVERKLYEKIMEHNQLSSSHNTVVYFDAVGEKHDKDYFKQILSLTEQIQGVYNSLKNNVLVDKHEQLSSLKDSFNTAFVTNLCHSIYQSINDGKRVLDDLNKELEFHVFGSDKESFSFSYEWVPEYLEYWKFFKEVIDIPSLGDGSTLFDVELSDKACLVRDRLLGMLLDKDSQSALRELQRISDYRHYRRYEIYKTPLHKEKIALSKYGTGSGGQLETPAYIIRAAAVTSAFKFNEGSSHCRMVLVDEAFSKMDETRSREVINYLTEALGLQLVFIMPTSKSGPFLDLISNQVVFTKCPTTEKVGELNTRVLVDRKACNQDKIQTLWSNHRKTIRQQAMLDFMDEIV
jgi:energy-coupling factor transporter ATP-binding protein EcfA2